MQLVHSTHAAVTVACSARGAPYDPPSNPILASEDQNEGEGGEERSRYWVLRRWRSLWDVLIMVGGVCGGSPSAFLRVGVSRPDLVPRDGILCRGSHGGGGSGVADLVLDPSLFCGRDHDTP